MQPELRTICLKAASIMRADASREAIDFPAFAAVLARLQLRADALFGAPICRVEAGDELVGPSGRLLPVRVRTTSSVIDLFLKQQHPRE